MTAWIKVQGSQTTRPAEIDTTSSSVTVYQRRNIERITVKCEDGSTAELWQYEERQMTREEYFMMQIEQNYANIDYLSMMTNINIPIIYGG